MHERPLFSIVTVVYNGEKFLEQTINSVINQDYPNVEYIIIDGGSQDSTCDIIRKYESQIAFWISEPDKGVYNAMNKGGQHAKGKYVSFLNSDDYLVPGSLKQVAEHIEETPADVYYGNQINVWEDEQEVLTRTCIPNMDVIEKKMGLFHPATFVKRSLFIQVEGFDESYSISGDYEFFIRLHKTGSIFHYMPVPIAAFRLGGASSSVRTYAEGLRIQFKHDLPYKRNMIGSLIKKAVKSQVYRLILNPSGLAQMRREKVKESWRRSQNKELIIQ